jgi:hypothetical protein
MRRTFSVEEAGMQFWQDFNPAVRWAAAIGVLLVFSLLTFRHCSQAEPVNVQRTRGIAAPP